MKFKDLLRKYQAGEVNDDEKRQVEAELEKYEALEAYFAEQWEFPLPDPAAADPQEEEARQIIKSVNSRLRKIVLTSVMIITACLLSIVFIISPLVDSFYYNPTKVSVGSREDDINFDLAALIELTQPGYALAGLAETDKLGFGSYDSYFYRTNLLTQETAEITMRIKRNKNYSKDLFRVEQPHFTAVEAPGFLSDVDLARQKERVLNHLRQLNRLAYAAAYLTFENDLIMDELEDLVVQKNHFLDFVWAGIRTAPQGQRMDFLSGFNLRPNTVFHSGDQRDTARYPAFLFWDWLTGNEGLPPGSSGRARWAVAAELHYKSLLRYLADRKEAVTALSNHPRQHQYYQAALAYVEEHGVYSYGVLVHATAADLIKLVETAPIKTLELDQVLASRRFIQ